MPTAQVVDGDQLLGILALDRLARGALPGGGSSSRSSRTAASRPPSRRPAARSSGRPVGDKYILEGMQVSGAGLGGEKSGHVIVLEHTTSGDGIVTALEVLRVMARRGAALAELAADDPAAAPAAAGRDGPSQGPVGGRPGPPGAPSPTRSGRLGADGRILVRPSGTEPALRVMVEGAGRGAGGRAGRRARGPRGGASKLARCPPIGAPRVRPASAAANGGPDGMCGIVGYTGPREAGPILIEGLKRLEYRGYDSAGIALVDDAGDLFVEKRAGKLANLQTAIADRTPHAAIGLAHTRWATHGRPNDLNAHPHQDCTGDITVIHNGIIENFRELRDGLEARGHRLTSETDTEALAHLVEEAYAGRPRRRGPRRPAPARRRLRASSSCTAASPTGSSAPGRTCRSSSGSPTARASSPATSRRSSPTPTRSIFLEEGDVADLRPCGRRRSPTSTARRASEPSPTIDWSPEAAEKGGYEHFMLKEIHEQPEALAPVASPAGSTRDGRIVVDELDGLADVAPRRRPGRARRLRQRLLRRRSSGPRRSRTGPGIPARATVGSEFRYSPPPLDAQTLVIAVTQSGETADTIAPTRLARERGCPVIAVTNTVGSAITREADAVLFLQAGPEIAVAASKTFVTQVTTLVDPRRGDRQGPRPLGASSELELGAALRALPAAAARAARDAVGDAPRPRPALRQLARVHVRRPRLHLSRPRSRARSSSRRSATSTPRAMRPAS